MKLIAITTEQIGKKEPIAICKLFEAGLTTLHLRKPASSKEEVCALLTQIDSSFHFRIVLHDHFSLTEQFTLKGVHLNRRNPLAPNSSQLSISKSCHSLNELTDVRQCNYVFLSPIFDSISKSGYQQAFTDKELIAACKAGLIGSNVFALGGISVDTIPPAAHYGFGGVAVLGALWGNYPNDTNEYALLKRWNKLYKQVANH